jgi:hypothetical protein
VFKLRHVCYEKIQLKPRKSDTHLALVAPASHGRTIVRDRYWVHVLCIVKDPRLVTRKTLTRKHVAFDTYGLYWKIPVCLDSPYLQQIAFIRKMYTNAVACRTSIRRFKRAGYQLIDQLNSVPKKFLGEKKVPWTGCVLVPGIGWPAHRENTQQVDQATRQGYYSKSTQYCDYTT